MALSRKKQLRYLKAIGKTPNGLSCKESLPDINLKTTQIVLKYLKNQDLLSFCKTKQAYVLNQNGRQWIRRAMSTADEAFKAQHQTILHDSIGQYKICENLTESPLKFLASARGQRPAYLQEAEIKAAEQLQRDLMLAGLVAKTTMSWERLQTGRIKEMSSAPQSEHSHMMTDCRKRIYKALQALGPQLSAVALDVCCFFKKLGEIEKERGLPQRSAKILLKIALERLAVFYGFMSEPAPIIGKSS